MSRVYTSVSRVASWAGWCSPCGQEDRPLVLTRSGPGGTAAWLKGLSDDDRILLLTCRVCGDWQFVPAREEDDPEIFLVEDDEVLVSEDVRQVVAGIVAEARATAPALPPRVRTADEDRAYDALATVEPILSLPAPAPLTAGLPVPRGEDADIDVPLVAPSADADVDIAWAPTHAPIEAPAAALPAPRPPVPRIVTVPEPVTLPAFSPEAVEAAARVLAAARAQTTAGAPRRSRHTSSPARSSRAARSGHPTSVRLITAADAPALPAVLGLPTNTHSVVLAAAS